MDLEQDTMIKVSNVIEDDADNTERNNNEENHLNNSEFIIIDKAQYAREQNHVEQNQVIEHNEEVLVDDSFSRQKDNENIFTSPYANCNVKLLETENTVYVSPERHSSVKINAFDVNARSNTKLDFEASKQRSNEMVQHGDQVCHECMASKYGVKKSDNFNSVLSNPTVTEFSPVRSYRYYNNEVFTKLKCFLDKMQASLVDNKRLDEKRACLTLRYDFCLTEIFNMVNKTTEGFINLEDLISWGNFNGLNLSSDDWEIILSRYDRDKDDCLSFKEFTEIFAPISSEYRKKLNKRSNMKKRKFSNYTVQTQKLLKDILQTIIVTELSFLHNNIVACKEVVENSQQVFTMIDINNKGHVDFYDFCVAWQKIESKSAYSSHMLKVLYDQFDRDKDGLISYEEFFMPTYSSPVL